MSMVERVKVIKFAVEGINPTSENWYADVDEAIAVALGEAEKVDKENHNLRVALETGARAMTRQDAAFQRAREAWRRWDHTEGWTGEDIDEADAILDEFFGGGEGEG